MQRPRQITAVWHMVDAAVSEPNLFLELSGHCSRLVRDAEGEMRAREVMMDVQRHSHPHVFSSRDPPH